MVNGDAAFRRLLGLQCRVAAILASKQRSFELVFAFLLRFLPLLLSMCRRRSSSCACSVHHQLGCPIQVGICQAGGSCRRVRRRLHIAIAVAIAIIRGIQSQVSQEIVDRRKLLMNKVYQILEFQCDDCWGRSEAERPWTLGNEHSVLQVCKIDTAMAISVQTSKEPPNVVVSPKAQGLRGLREGLQGEVALVLQVEQVPGTLQIERGHVGQRLHKTFQIVGLGSL
mmetsp:Transcript_50892/g.110153  ORF Transcript_50892/g.110153 Transcript_50892/m.110153 type:complete len:226 (+) Transcript_50892:1399-2076(+)